MERARERVCVCVCVPSCSYLSLHLSHFFLFHLSSFHPPFLSLSSPLSLSLLPFHFYPSPLSLSHFFLFHLFTLPLLSLSPTCFSLFSTKRDTRHEIAVPAAKVMTRQFCVPSQQPSLARGRVVSAIVLFLLWFAGLGCFWTVSGSRNRLCRMFVNIFHNRVTWTCKKRVENAQALL